MKMILHRTRKVGGNLSAPTFIRVNPRLTFLCRPFGAPVSFSVACPGLTPGATLCHLLRRLVAAVLLAGLSASFIASAQTTPIPNATQNPALSRYLDQTSG